MSIRVLPCLLLALACASPPPVPTAPVQRPEVLPRLAANTDATVMVRLIHGHGSGTVISRSGHILTARHVVIAENVRPRIFYGEETNTKMLPEEYFAADIGDLVATSEELDLSVLKVERTFADPARMADADLPIPGEMLYSISRPLAFRRSVLHGTVMSLRAPTRQEYGPGSQSFLMDMHTAFGSSGCVTYRQYDGAYIGLNNTLHVQFYSDGETPGEPSMQFSYAGAVALASIRPFLERHRIPYVKLDGTEKTYPPVPLLPAPVPLPTP